MKRSTKWLVATWVFMGLASVCLVSCGVAGAPSVSGGVFGFLGLIFLVALCVTVQRWSDIRSLEQMEAFRQHWREEREFRRSVSLREVQQALTGEQSFPQLFLRGWLRCRQPFDTIPLSQVSEVLYDTQRILEIDERGALEIFCCALWRGVVIPIKDKKEPAFGLSEDVQRSLYDSVREKRKKEQPRTDAA